MSKKRLLLSSALCAIVSLYSTTTLSGLAHADVLPTDKEIPLVEKGEEPVKVEALQEYVAPEKSFDEKNDLPFDIRKEAMKEAAISFGARGGLAKRTHEIRRELDTRSRYLDKVYDFGQLLIAAPSGFMIEPPIVSESMNAMLIDLDGQTAAVTDKMYNIIRNAKIVSSPRTWRIYLEREWGIVFPPPDILTPRDDEERYLWRQHVELGWNQGVQMANDVFKADLARLESDFTGMIRYRMLLAQGMVSPPYALQVDRGITGGGNEMRIGDRAVQITGVPVLVNGPDQWKPASQ